jgi:hypothetical protein
VPLLLLANQPRYIAEEHVPFDKFSAPVGSKLRLVPSHGCTTCNLHRRLWIARRELIEDVWPIEASGCLEQSILNVADHRPRACGVRFETATSSRGSVDLLCVRLTWA